MLRVFTEPTCNHTVPLDHHCCHFQRKIRLYSALFVPSFMKNLQLVQNLLSWAGLFMYGYDVTKTAFSYEISKAGETVL
jgi:hypothetical protein